MATKPDELKRPGKEIGWRSCRRVANNAKKRRLHRSCRDLEGLKKIGSHSGSDNDRNQENLYIFPPTGILWGRRNPPDRALNLVPDCVNLISLATLKGLLELGEQVSQDAEILLAKDILLVMNQAL